MTDNRPEPRYGQYAPVPPAPAAPTPAAPTPVAASPVALPARRTWDVVLTTALLLFGVFDVVTGFPQFAHLADALRIAYASQGFGDFTSDALAATMGAAINIARITILAIAVVVSLLLIRAHRLAFWIPLVAAAVGGVVVTVCVFVVILGDPALAAYVATQSATP